jgi:hypothetical protein
MLQYGNGISVITCNYVYYHNCVTVSHTLPEIAVSWKQSTAPKVFCMVLLLLYMSEALIPYYYKQALLNCMNTFHHEFN